MRPPGPHATCPAPWPQSRLLPDHPYAAFLNPRGEARSLRRRGGGRHAEGLGSVEARVCLAFPDIYDIGMSRLGSRFFTRSSTMTPDPGRALLRAIGRHGGAAPRSAGCRSCRSKARGRCGTSTSWASRSSSSWSVASYWSSLDNTRLSRRRALSPPEAPHWVQPSSPRAVGVNKSSSGRSD